MQKTLVAHHTFGYVVAEDQSFRLVQIFLAPLDRVGHGQVPGFAHDLLQARVVVGVGGEGAVIAARFTPFLFGDLGIE